MKKIDVRLAHNDERGQIIDLLENEDITAATLITCRKDSVRGNHYHGETFQWNYVLAGKIKLLTRQPNSKVIETIMQKGDFVVTVPNEVHALIALEDSVLLVFAKGPRSGRGYETDTIRLKESLEATK